LGCNTLKKETMKNGENFESETLWGKYQEVFYVENDDDTSPVLNQDANDRFVKTLIRGVCNNAPDPLTREIDIGKGVIASYIGRIYGDYFEGEGGKKIGIMCISEVECTYGKVIIAGEILLVAVEFHRNESPTYGKDLYIIRNPEEALLKL